MLNRGRDSEDAKTDIRRSAPPTRNNKDATRLRTLRTARSSKKGSHLVCCIATEKPGEQDEDCHNARLDD